MMTGKSPNIRRKLYPSATLSTTNPTWTMKAGLHDKKPMVLRSIAVVVVVVEVGIVVDRSEKSVQFTDYKVPARADPSSRGVLPRDKLCVCVCVCVFERDQMQQ